MVTIGPDVRAQAGRDTELDDEWRGLVAEAAAAAGIERERAEATRRARADAVRVGIVRSLAPAAERRDAEHAGGQVSLDVTRGSRAPESPLAAGLTGELVTGSAASAVSADVDLDSRELSLTCQTGQFSVHHQASSTFPAAHRSASGAYNLARAEIAAELPAARFDELGPSRVVAGVHVPVAFDNTLQRVWRLAVPSRDMLKSDDRAHMAVAGVRGRITLTVEGAGLTLRCTRRFLNRSISAHAPGQASGFGPIKGLHLLEIDLNGIQVESDLAVSVEVSLLSVLAGNPDDYEPGAPFYAGVDFGGGGSVRLPNECLSSFEIPLTPLIGNHSISVAHLGLARHD